MIGKTDTVAIGWCDNGTTDEEAPYFYYGKIRTIKTITAGSFLL